MDLTLTELNVRFNSNEEQLLLEVINYISTGSPKISSIGLLRDGSHLIKIISIYERQTRWQSSHIIDLFFKFKNDVINGYSFINGWIDTYYHCGYAIVGDEFRFATNQDVMIIALLVLNVLYTKRQSLTNDLKTRLDALWIDFSSTVDSIVLWMRTRAQLIDSNSNLHSCAHQLFSGHSLFEYQAFQQRLTSMVQQKLIDEQIKRLDEKELTILKQNKDYSELVNKMLETMQELNEVKTSNTSLVEEVKWQKGLNCELNEMVLKLKEENLSLKKLLYKENGISNDLNGMTCAQTFNDSNDISEKTERIGTYDTLDSEDTEHKLSQDETSDDNFESSTELLLDTNVDEYERDCDPIETKTELDISSSFHSNNDLRIDNNCGLNMECNTIGLNEKTSDTDSSTETEDIIDSGNHSDAAADDMLLEMNQCCLQKELNINNPITDHNKDEVFNFHSWQEFFANDSNNVHDLQNDHQIGQQIDTYNNKSNQCLGTNDNRICINFIEY